MGDVERYTLDGVISVASYIKGSDMYVWEFKEENGNIYDADVCDAVDSILRAFHQPISDEGDKARIVLEIKRRQRRQGNA